MKVFLFLILTLLFNCFVSNVNAQACGYTFLTIYLTDSKGQSIKNAKIETFDKDFKKKYFLYPEKENSPDPLERPMAWSEKKQAYFGSEGMCGGHRDMGFRILAEGFEKYDIVIDLPLGWTGYLIKLKHQNSNEVTTFTRLNRVEGKVISISEDGIPNAKIIVYQDEKTQFQTFSDLDGDFEIFLPTGNYRFTISAEGFKRTQIEKVDVLADKINELNITMIISDVTEHRGLSKIKIIKRKNNK